MIDQIDQTSIIDTVYFIIQTIFEQYLNEAIVLVKRNTNETKPLCLSKSKPTTRSEIKWEQDPGSGRINSCQAVYGKYFCKRQMKFAKV